MIQIKWRRVGTFLGIAIFVLAGIFSMTLFAFAAPAVTSVTGTWDHGTPTVVSGSGFGIKTTAAPVVWDDASTGTLLTDNGKWSGAWPNRGSDLSYITQYHAPMRGIALPHNHITRYIAGAHGLANEGYDAGYNVMFWKTIDLTSYPFTFYVSWYQMIDPAASPLRSDWNLKTFDWSSGGSPYAMNSCVNNNWYLNYAPTGVPLTTSTSSAQHQLNDDSWGYAGCGGSLQNPDVNGHSALWWISGKNPLNYWIKMELEIRITDQSSGYIRVWEDGALKVSYAGRTDTWALGNRSIGIGGYSRDYGPNHWRYFADAYLDYTPQRVVLTNNSNINNATIKEVQIPTAWTDTSVTFTTNLGQFQPGQIAYLYVIDFNGNANPTGYPVTIGSGGSTTTYTVTPSVGSNGTISPNTVQTVNSGSIATFTITPNSGYTASVGGTCGGNLSGTMYTTNAVTVDCTVVANFSASGDTTPPTSPTNLAANAMGETSITVSWDPSVDNVGVVRYDIERCPGLSCSNFTQVGTTQNSPYTDSGLTASTGYSYHVRAVDAAGNTSGWSNVVGATTDAATPSNETIIDNTDTASVSSSGTWVSSTAYPGYYGSDYLYSSTADGEWFQWTTSTLTPGTYEVYARWPATTGRPTDTSYQITHSLGTATVGPINQEVNGSQWNLLGTYTFDTTGTVRVIGTATGWEGTAADAVRFLNVSSTPQPCSTITTPTTWNTINHTGYATPYDLFDANNLILQGSCTPGTPTQLNLAIGKSNDPLIFSFDSGYYWNGTDWTPYTLSNASCDGLTASGGWCQGTTTGTVTSTNIDTGNATIPQYFLGLTCRYTGSLPWKCGCQDTACTSPSWQLQGAALP